MSTLLFESIRPRAADLFLLSPDVTTVSSPTDPRLVPIGQLVADKDNYGWITFAVPDIAPGP